MTLDIHDSKCLGKILMLYATKLVNESGRELYLAMISLIVVIARCLNKINSRLMRVITWFHIVYRPEMSKTYSI